MSPWTGTRGTRRNTDSRSSQWPSRLSVPFGIEVGAGLDDVSPGFYLPLAPDVVRGLVPRSSRALHRLLGADASVERLLEVHVERVEILTVALQREHRHRDLRVLQRHVEELVAVLGGDARIPEVRGTERVPEPVGIGDRAVADLRPGEPLQEPVRRLRVLAVSAHHVVGARRLNRSADQLAPDDAAGHDAAPYLARDQRALRLLRVADDRWEREDRERVALGEERVVLRGAPPEDVLRHVRGERDHLPGRLDAFGTGNEGLHVPVEHELVL